MKSVAEMNGYEKLIAALTIFNSYPHSYKYVSAEHDEIFAGPSPADVSDEHKEQLKELGWNSDDSGSGFSSFV